MPRQCRSSSFRGVLDQIQGHFQELTSLFSLLEQENEELHLRCGSSCRPPRIRDEDVEETSQQLLDGRCQVQIAPLTKISKHLGDTIPDGEPSTPRSEFSEESECASRRADQRCSAYVSEQVDLVKALEIWPEWVQVTKQFVSRSGRVYSANSAGLVCQSASLRAGDSLSTRSLMQRFVSRPSSPRRIVWDLMSVFVMGYDVIAIPLQVFAMPQTVFEYVASALTTCFWTFDLIASFFAGYNTGGIIEMRPGKVAKRYITTWFVIDINVVAVDWVILLFDAQSAEGLGLIRFNKTFRFVRLLRVLRLLRLLRIAKVLSLMVELHDMIHSETVLTSLNVVQFIIGILLLNHYIACAWYGIGRYHLGEASALYSWVGQLDSEYGRTPSDVYLYITALHWSLTQFTPASMEIVPTNVVERCFTICILLFAVVLFSSLLSSITTNMINLRKMSTERRQQQSYVRRYITHNRVTLDLGNRIYTFLRHHNYNITQKKHLHEQEIIAFKVLPESLRTQLRCEVFLPTLIWHPLFRNFMHIDDASVIAICQRAVSEIDLALGQELFTCGTPAVSMFFSTSGNSMYFHGHSAHKPVILPPRSFISEAVLWMVWEHRGRLVASKPCELIVVSSVAFRSVLVKTPALGLAKSYAAEFHKYNVALVGEDNDLDALTDLPASAESLDSMTLAAYKEYCFSEGVDAVGNPLMPPHAHRSHRAGSVVLGNLVKPTLNGRLGRMCTRGWCGKKRAWSYDDDIW